MATILIVEDEIVIRQIAEWTMEDLGHHSLSAGDLAGALLHLSGEGPIDALFVDIRLDTLAFGGYAIANEAARLRPGLPMLYTSGTPLSAEMTAAFVDGSHFIQKPYSPEQLGHSVGNLLQRLTFRGD